MVSIGEKIKYLRKINNLTQPELAEKLGVQKSAIAKYELNQLSEMKFSTIIKLAEIFNVTTEYFVPSVELSDEFCDLENTNRYKLLDEVEKGFYVLNKVGKIKVLNYINDIKDKYKRSDI